MLISLFASLNKLYIMLLVLIGMQCFSRKLQMHNKKVFLNFKLKEKITYKFSPTESCIKMQIQPEYIIGSSSKNGSYATLQIPYGTISIFFINKTFRHNIKLFRICIHISHVVYNFSRPICYATTILIYCEC